MDFSLDYTNTVQKLGESCKRENETAFAVFYLTIEGKNMAEPSQSKELKNVLAQIEKDIGKGAIMQLGEASAVDVQGIPTGALSLDIALGGRGLPRGRIIEIFGPESSGKTTVALHAVANAQKQGGVAAYIDAEHALDPGWAKRIGVDLESLLVSQPGHAEEALKHRRDAGQVQRRGHHRHRLGGRAGAQGRDRRRDRRFARRHCKPA